MAARRIFSAGAAASAGDVPLTVDSFAGRPTRDGTVLAWLERHALFIAGLAAVTAAILGTLRLHVNQDAWLALVDGRYLADYGIPHHDTLTVITHGAAWIDQQWLAQLAIYGVYRVGGLALYGIVYVGLTVAAMGLALAAARRLGGRDVHVLWVLPLAAFLFFAGSFEVRTQGFAYPLFVGVLWLLAADARAPSRRRVYLVLPLLILWSNLHGSAIIGAGLAVLYGLSLIVEELRTQRRLRVPRRAIAMVVGAPLCLLVTPYGIQGVTYYRQTLMNPVFKALVTEWRPITSAAVLAIPFFVAAFATVWILGQSRSRARLFEALTLLMLIAAGISAIRNVTWFALAALVLLPSTLSAIVPARPAAPRRRRLNLTLVGATLVVLLGSVISVAAKPQSWFEHGYDTRALGAVAAQVHKHPGARIFADIHFGDWLLWHEPDLAGRVAYDARLELLTTTQLRKLTTLTEIQPPNTPDLLAGYGLFVLDRTDASNVKLMLVRTGAHIVWQGRGIAVAARSGA